MQNCPITRDYIYDHPRVSAAALVAVAAAAGEAVLQWQCYADATVASAEAVSRARCKRLLLREIINDLGRLAAAADDRCDRHTFIQV